jgi:hypothetical protein
MGDTKHPTCPKHETYMVPNPPEPVDAALPQGVEVFRCPNLSCSIFYATGALEGFYHFESNGNFTPYLNPHAV